MQIKSKLEDSVVLITGGAGNIGSFICDQVLEKNPKLSIIVDNLFNSDKKYIPENDNIIFYNLDIASLEEMIYIFEKHRPDYVFHCASMLIKDGEILPRKAINTNIVGTFNIVDLSNKYGVKKMSYSSSASVYGEPKYLPVDEKHPYQFNNFVYGWTKITKEMIFLSHAQFDWIGFRYYNVYSERTRGGTFYTQVLPIFYNKILNGDTITIFGDGNQTMDLIHAADIARANLFGLESDITGEFFNVGSGTETSVNDLAYMMMNIMNKQTKIKYNPDDSQKVRNRRSDTTKISSMLKFKPEIDLNTGLKRVINTLKKGEGLWLYVKLR